jgi:putative ABC transport system ATP-binding protein
MVRTENLCKAYESRSGVVKVLSDLNLTVEKGKCLLLRGPSGSGKSTLLSLMGCLTHPSSGRVLLGGREVSHLPDHFLTDVRRKMIGFVFQAFNLLSDFTVLDNIGMPLVPLGVPHAERRRRALVLLRRVNLEHRADFRVNDLSGGEQQRAAVARALINDPAIIIADEPNSNIDPKNASAVLELFCELKHEGRTIVVSSHDPSFAFNGLVDEVLTLGAAP